jgi:hypothetical protein
VAYPGGVIRLVFVPVVVAPVFVAPVFAPVVVCALAVGNIDEAFQLVFPRLPKKFPTAPSAPPTAGLYPLFCPLVVGVVAEAFGEAIWLPFIVFDGDIKPAKGFAAVAPIGCVGPISVPIVI